MSGMIFEWSLNSPLQNTIINSFIVNLGAINDVYLMWSKTNQQVNLKVFSICVLYTEQIINQIWQHIYLIRLETSYILCAISMNYNMLISPYINMGIYQNLNKKMREKKKYHNNEI